MKCIPSQKKLEVSYFKGRVLVHSGMFLSQQCKNSVCVQWGAKGHYDPLDYKRGGQNEGAMAPLPPVADVLEGHSPSPAGIWSISKTLKRTSFTAEVRSLIRVCWLDTGESIKRNAVLWIRSSNLSALWAQYTYSLSYHMILNSKLAT